MSLVIVPVGQIFGKYEKQARIAELISKRPVKSIQNQADRVTISSEARKEQVLGIARAVRDASKQLPMESKSLDKTQSPHDSNVKPLSLSESIVQKSLDKSRDALKDKKMKMEETIEKTLTKSNKLDG